MDNLLMAMGGMLGNRLGSDVPPAHPEVLEGGEIRSVVESRRVG